MLAYYLELAVISLRRHKVLTALMVVAIALGIGASMTTLTVLRVLSGDPLPQKSHAIFRPQLDSAGSDGYRPGEEPPDQLTRFDAEALLRAGRADRQALMSGGFVALDPDSEDLSPFYVGARYTSTDFFPMFAVPFLHGGPWPASDDQSGARVVVISRELNDKLFAGDDSVGRSLRLHGTTFRVTGVLDRWRPVPRFYDLTSRGDFGTAEEVYVPFSTSRQLELGHSGTMSCYGERPEGQQSTDLGAPCLWIQFWVELGSEERAEGYAAFLRNYSDAQRAAGRFERPTNVRLRNLTEWLAYQEVVPDDVQLQTLLAFCFLLVCLLNTVGLLLAKFLRRAPEIGVRRALGASRRAIFAQLVVEAGLIGLAGGLLGLGLAALGLWAVRQQPTDYADLAHLDATMLVATLALALVASLLAGVLPAWRGCRITPAIQLKSQ